MIDLYDETDYIKAVALKKKLFAIYLAVSGVFVGVAALFFILFLLMPYALTEELIAKKETYMVLDCVVSVLYIIFSFIYLCIPYRRVKYYLKMLDGMKTGDKATNYGTFLQNYDSIVDKNFVDHCVMAVLEWCETSQTYVRRHVLVDKEKQMPNFKNGDMIVYVTHANVLMSYGLKSEEDIFEDFNGEEKENADEKK